MRCPVCKADNAQGPLCRRCKADLGLLLQLEEERAAVLTAARQRLDVGNLAEAERLARRADGLRRDDESRRLLTAVWLLQRDYARAWGLFQEGRGETAAVNGTDGERGASAPC